MKRLTRTTTGIVMLALATLTGWLLATWSAPPLIAAGQKSEVGWTKGKGWGWIWGAEDQVGALNSLTNDSRAAALRLAKTGEVFDLGVNYSRNSFKWPGHSPGEIMTFRSPEGVKRQQDLEFARPPKNPNGGGWHSCALFISDNVGTQIDGLGHVTIGDDDHCYNGFKEADWGGNFGVRKCSASGIPPVIARGVLLDIAGLKQVRSLPPHYAITPADIDAAAKAQKLELRVGDVVLLRTGSLSFWGEDGAEVDKLKEPDTAGINLAAAKYLVEQKGAVAIGSDTSGLEVTPPVDGDDPFIPVHQFLLIQQGVYILEFHYLEDLAKAKVYEFCYVASTNKIVGAAAGFCMRPLAIR